MILRQTWNIECTVNPADPQAVSTTLSLSPGFIILTHMSMTHRGVKYWPFSPLDDFETRYSNASSMTSRLELKSFHSSRELTQTCRWSGEPFGHREL